MSVWHGPAVFGAPVRAGDFIDDRCVENLVNEMMYILEVHHRRMSFPIFVITEGSIPHNPIGIRRKFFVTGVLTDSQFNLQLSGEQDYSKPASSDWPEVFSQSVDGGEVRPAVKEAFIHLLRSQPNWLDVDVGWKMDPLVINPSGLARA